MKLIMENWNNFLNEAEQYGTMTGDKFVVDLKRMNIIATDHGEERRFRHVKQGKGKISRTSITKAIETAMGLIMNDFSNGEIMNKEPFHIKAKQGKQPILNVIASLDVKPGPDNIVIITVMRKDNFGTSDFGKGGRPQKTYEVSI